MCSGSEAGSYLRLIDCVSHSTLGVRVIEKKKKVANLQPLRPSSLRGLRRRAEASKSAVEG